MLRRVLAVIFEGVSVLTALLFLFGWAYYWAFLESVQLDLPVLDLPLWSFLIEGSTMALLAFGTVLERLNRALWAIVAVGLLLLVVMLLLRWRAPSKVTALRTNHFPRIADFLRRKKQEWRFLHTGIKTFIVALLTFVTVLGFLVGGLNLAVKSGRSEYRRLVDHPSDSSALL